MVVFDCSIAVALVMPDENSPYADAVLEHMSRHSLVPAVPSFFRWEVANALLMSERRKRIDAKKCRESLNYWLFDALLHEDGEANPETVIALSREHRLTVYDALYLELAVRLKAPLATLDAALAKAAKREKVAFRP